MDTKKEEKVYICRICGYQWTEDVLLFFAECPVCESQMVSERRDTWEPDNRPWW